MLMEKKVCERLLKNVYLEAHNRHFLKGFSAGLLQ